MPTFVKVIISIAIIVVGIILLLFISAKLMGFQSIGALLAHMAGELRLMWSRITA